MRKKGITTILKASLLLVLTSLILIGVLLLISSPLSHPENPELTAPMKTEFQIKNVFKLGLVPYRLDTGSYPTTDEGLVALLHSPNGKENEWKGPYLKELPLDAWNRPYQYKFPGEKNINGQRGYDLWSWGPDGIPSEDDITNWNKPKS